MAEYRAIRNALPSHGLRINSTKSMIGHLLGAAGAVEAVATIQALQTGQDLSQAVLCFAVLCCAGLGCLVIWPMVHLVSLMMCLHVTASVFRFCKPSVVVSGRYTSFFLLRQVSGIKV